MIAAFENNAQRNRNATNAVFREPKLAQICCYVRIWQQLNTSSVKFLLLSCATGGTWHRVRYSESALAFYRTKQTKKSFRRELKTAACTTTSHTGPYPNKENAPPCTKETR
jgi:hypothetical protein